MDMDMDGKFHIHGKPDKNLLTGFFTFHMDPSGQLRGLDPLAPFQPATPLPSECFTVPSWSLYCDRTWRPSCATSTEPVICLASWQELIGNVDRNARKTDCTTTNYVGPTLCWTIRLLQHTAEPWRRLPVRHVRRMIVPRRPFVHTMMYTCKSLTIMR